MPLSDMLKFMVESGDPATWEATRQKRLSGEYELESKRRALEADQQLRDLYAKNPNPSFGATAAISPEYAQKMLQFQNEQYLKGLQAQETKGKIDLQSADQAAAAAFPALVTYQENIQRGMPEAQAREMFHSMNGKVVADAAQSGATWLQSGASYDPNKVDPENVRALNARFGRFTPFDQLQQKSKEESMRTGYGMQLKGTPSVSERTFIGPDGLPHPMPSQYLQPGGQPPVQSTIKPYPVFTFNGKTYEGPEFMRMVIKEKDPAKKQLMEEIIDAGFKQQQEGTLTDPNAVMPKTKQELEVETDIQKQRGKLQVEDEQDAENKLSTIASMPSDDELMKYLNDSTLGKGEEILKGPVASFFHIQNEAQAADTVLGALQENIKNIATKAKGDMNISEVKNYESAVGALNNKELGPQARFQAYLAAKNMAIKKIAMKHPEIAKKYGMGTAAQTNAQNPRIAKTEEEAHKFATTLPAGSQFTYENKTYVVKGR